MRIGDFQKLIEATYLEKDRARGFERTFMWFVEEVGELSRAVVKEEGPVRLAEEFSDVLAWLSTLASLSGIDLEQAARRYAEGCPKCLAIPCTCGQAEAVS